MLDDNGSDLAQEVFLLLLNETVTTGLKDVSKDKNL